VPQRTLVACIDDDQGVCEAIEELLRVCGFTALGFSSAEEFLQSERLKEVQCLVTDVQLSGMSGLQLLERLADMGASIPAIVITAFPEEQIRERALKAGALCFLSKPVTKDSLLKCIRSALK